MKRSYLEHIGAVVRTNRPLEIVVLFFFLLFWGLFLGDGKQGLIEVFSASVVLVLWGIIFFSDQKIPALPRSLIIPWVAFWIVSLLSTIGSDSVGYSVSWLVRFWSGYLIYRLFITLASPRIIKSFVISLLAFVAVAGLLFMSAYLGPGLRLATPPMNLLFLRFGHSHFADLLVFVVPYICLYIFQSGAPRLLKYSTGILFFTLLLLTFSRGAWLITGLFMGYVFANFNLDKRRATRVFVVTLVVAIVCFIISLTNTNAFSRGVVARYNDFRERAARPLSTSSRLEYWRQAVEGIKDKPFLGSGPGTFSLTSVRFQKSPGQFSWFAHSEPLQVASELGLVGLGVYAWVLLCHGVLYFRNKKLLVNLAPHTAAALCSVGLIFLYGAFEFVLDFYIIWLLLWSTLGLLTGLGSYEPRVDSRQPRDVFILLVFVGIFYISWVSGALLTTISKQYDLAYYVAPYDATSALVALEKRPELATDRLTQYFFRNNPTVLIARARFTQRTDAYTATQLFKRATTKDPQNVEYFGEYMDALIGQGAQDEAAIVLGVDPSLSSYLTKELFLDVGRPERKSEYFAKLYYFLGLAVLPENPTQTKSLWTEARNLLPWWGHFHVELASLYKNYLHDEEEVENILRECQKYESSREQCRQAQVNGVAAVGSLVNEIRLIPRRP